MFVYSFSHALIVVGPYRRLNAMVENLNKMCSASAYMYLYSQRLLGGVEGILRAGADGGGVHRDGDTVGTGGTNRASKYRRLRQELQAGTTAGASMQSKTRGFVQQLAIGPVLETDQMNPALVRANRIEMLWPQLPSCITLPSSSLLVSPRPAARRTVDTRQGSGHY